MRCAFIPILSIPMSSRSTSRPGLHRALLATALLALLAACGGSTSQRDPFVAQRLFALGDEASVLLPDPTVPPSTTAALKYSPNVDFGVAPAVQISCADQPLWIQSVAALYGFTFKECNPGNVAEPLAATFATVGARVADIEAQAARAGAFREKDLVTVMMGTNDVLQAYRAIIDSQGSVTEDQVAGELRNRAETLANKINQIVGLGARVIVATVPDLGLSPFGRTEEAVGAGRAELLTRLTTAFNEQLGIKILLDGSLIGLVQTDQMVQAMVRSPGNFGLINAVDAVCLPSRPLPTCTTRADSLIPGGDAGTFLWADGTRMSFGGHSYLGRLAQDRATRNPF
jgi:outer membrane lipase/esterase